MAETMTEVPPNAAETSFGYRSVPEEERQTLVNRVFATVAERYDLMNDLMSGGLHRLWKDDLIAALNPPPRRQAYRLLDVAGGTGDVAIRYARASGPNATAVLCDISPEMIEVGGAPRACGGARRPHQLRAGQRRGAAVRRPRASTPTRSRSASATSPTSTRR